MTLQVGDAAQMANLVKTLCKINHQNTSRSTSSVSFLVSRENSCNVYDMGVLARNKNDAIPPNPLPVVAFPLLALERHDIASKRILIHLSEFFEQELVIITRHPFELSYRGFCEPDLPFH